MTTIKRLIFKEWFKAFFASVIVLATLVTVADLISGFLRGSVTATQVILNHIVEYPAYLAQIFPVGCLIASLFSINKLKNRNELTAIFASGFTRKKFIFTIFQASLIIAILQFTTSAYIQPYFKQYRHQLLGDAQERFSNLEGQGLKASTIGTGKVWFKSGDYFASFAQYDRNTKTLYDATFYFLDTNEKLKQKIVTPMLIHGEHHKWEAINATSFEDLSQLQFPKITHHDSLFITINETPNDFIQLESDITTLGAVQLWRYIRQLQRAGLNVSEYLILFLGHFSTTIICIIFALVAGTTAFNPNRRNSSFGKSLGFVFLFTLFYWLVFSYLSELGRSGQLDPYIASFSVPLLFSFILLLFFFHHRKLRG